MKLKFKNLPSVIVFLCTSIVAALLYVFNTYFCTSDCYIFWERPYLRPVFLTLLALLPTLILLLFFSNDIFISWLWYLGWWYVPAVLSFAMNNDNESDFSPFASDSFVAYFFMGILFVVTLVFAVVAWWRVRALTKKRNLSSSNSR